MNTILTILLILAMIGTLAVLVMGLVQMVRGEANAGRSNRLMQYRVVFQAVALVLFLGLMWMLKR